MDVLLIIEINRQLERVCHNYNVGFEYDFKEGKVISARIKDPRSKLALVLSRETLFKGTHEIEKQISQYINLVQRRKLK